jgi:hypothetical protein
VEAIGLFYDIENNCFVDEDGFIVYNIYSLVRPSDIFLFRRNKEYMLVVGVYGDLVELYYPDDDGDSQDDWDDYIERSLCCEST